jgi:hypothetical protein
MLSEAACVVTREMENIFVYIMYLWSSLYRIFTFYEIGHAIKLNFCAGNFEQSKQARNQVGIVLSYRPARLHRLAELIPWHRFVGSLKVLTKLGLSDFCLQRRIRFCSTKTCIFYHGWDRNPYVKIHNASIFCHIVSFL